MSTQTYGKLIPLVLLLLCLPLAAQETDDSETEGSAGEQPAEESQKESQAEDGESDKDSTDDDFRPSEEISEDLSVSFPVDI